MRYLENVIWFICVGWWTGLIWFIGAIVLIKSIVGIRVSGDAFRMADMSVCPFGKEVVHFSEIDLNYLGQKRPSAGVYIFIMNCLWCVSFGLILFLLYLIVGFFFYITILGIPLGAKSFKLAMVALWPFGSVIITSNALLVLEDAKRQVLLMRRRGKRVLID